jgi:hypothetical protein
MDKRLARSFAPSGEAFFYSITTGICWWSHKTAFTSQELAHGSCICPWKLGFTQVLKKGKKREISYKNPSNFGLKIVLQLMPKSTPRKSLVISELHKLS